MSNPVYIKSISFHNCQSLKDVTYNLIPGAGINVITAPNSAGKSVLYKAIKLAVGANFFSRTELVHMISYGAKEAIAVFEFTDESAGGFIISEKNLIYVYKGCEEECYQKYTAPNTEFINKMSIVIDDETKFVMNILDPDQELLFINSKESTNFSILKLVSDNEKLEEIIPLLDEKESDVKAYLNKAFTTNTFIHNRLDQFEQVNLSSLKQKIEYGSFFIPLGRSLLSILCSLEKMEVYDFINLELCDNLILVLFSYEKVIACTERFQFNKKVDYEPLSILAECLSLYEKILKGVDSIISDIEIIYKCKRCLDQAYKDMAKISDIIICPVKGKVCFFEGGCIEYCGEKK